MRAYRSSRFQPSQAPERTNSGTRSALAYRRHQWSKQTATDFGFLFSTVHAVSRRRKSCQTRRPIQGLAAEIPSFSALLKAFPPFDDLFGERHLSGVVCGPENPFRTNWLVIRLLFQRRWRKANAERVQERSGANGRSRL